MAAEWSSRSATIGRMAPLEAGLEQVGQPQRILEIGTGSGVGAEIIVERFPDAEVTAVDISEPMLATARERLPQRVRLEVADAGALPFDDAAFDLVVQMNVPVYFAEIARVTAPDGRVLVASSLGPRTPYYTPHSVLRRKFRRLGLREHAAKTVEPGDYFVARRES
jgi:ubiquinone/menaquinone biosynthesis C-methylase UbiE